MNNLSHTYTDTHLGWKQRVKREIGAQKLYTEKGYEPFESQKDYKNILSKVNQY